MELTSSPKDITLLLSDKNFDWTFRLLLVELTAIEYTEYRSSLEFIETSLLIENDDELASHRLLSGCRTYRIKELVRIMKNKHLLARDENEDLILNLNYAQYDELLIIWMGVPEDALMTESSTGKVATSEKYQKRIAEIFQSDWDEHRELIESFDYEIIYDSEHSA